MWNPWSKAKKAVEKKLSKKAIAALIVALLGISGLAISEDAQQKLADAFSTVIVEIMDAPPAPAVEEPTNDE